MVVESRAEAGEVKELLVRAYDCLCILNIYIHYFMYNIQYPTTHPLTHPPAHPPPKNTPPQPPKHTPQDICREYKTAIRLKAAIAALPPDDAKRQIELAAYFTHCAFQPAHLLLALRMAMVAAFKVR